MKLRNYYVKAGQEFFEYADGHFHMTNRIPCGHRNILEANRALDYARRSLGCAGAKIVTLEVTATEVDAKEVHEEMAKNVRRILEAKLDPHEFEWFKKNYVRRDND